MSQQDDPQLYAMRHSLAHIMATAVKRLWPETKFGIGPVISNGFYYDIDAPQPISESDFKRIEKEMRAIINQDQPFEHSMMPIEDAIRWAQENNQPYKEELLNDLHREGTTVAKSLTPEEMGTFSEGEGQTTEVGFYTNGEFTDLCRGPHVESTGKVGVFKLMWVAGVYWRGDENKPQMQRITGAAFATQEELNSHLQMLEEAKKRDHRKLGKELDLFVLSDMVGSGLPMFTPRGTWLRELLGGYSQQLRADRGYEKVWSPHITKPELYQASGHWDKFGDELFKVESQESSDVFALKPMNCPHHTRIYAAHPRSYKDLPIKYMENATDYRDEKTGELHGLTRVRAFTQDDSHVFCRPDQIERMATELVEAAKELYSTLDMDLSIDLSFRDAGDGYLGDQSLWDSAQQQIEQLVKKAGLEYQIVEGEAAFYGPKIDFLVTDAIGRSWQVATVQLDFVQPSPERFNLEYTDETGAKQTPVMIHCALLGSIERFLSLYIEHTAGVFPFWVAPEQIRILTINDEMKGYVGEIEQVLRSVVLDKPLRFNALRWKVDGRNESLGKKIREAQKSKLPLMMIVGPKDQEARTVSLRKHDGAEETVPLDGLADYLSQL